MVLTNKDVAHQGSRQAEHNDKDIGHGEVDDEEICDSPHAGGPIHDGNDKTIADEADDEDEDIGDTVDRGHSHAVPVETIGDLLGGREVDRFAGVQQSAVLFHGRPRIGGDGLRDEVVQIATEVVPHLQECASGGWNGRDGRRRHVAVIAPTSRVHVELVGVR